MPWHRTQAPSRSDREAMPDDPRDPAQGPLHVDLRHGASRREADSRSNGSRLTLNRSVTHMARMMSACGVWCSDCPAYLGSTRGAAYQARVAEAWQRIYHLGEPPENISCGGCLAGDDKVFHTSVRCGARRCCRRKRLASCAACSKTGCRVLEKAQSVWDEVPQLSSALSHDDFVTYAKPYCGHRRRLEVARTANRPRSRSASARPGRRER